MRRILKPVFQYELYVSKVVNEISCALHMCPKRIVLFLKHVINKNKTPKFAKFIRKKKANRFEKENQGSRCNYLV